LVACDLRDTAQLSAKLDACGVNHQLPTAFIAECVLVYMTAEKSSALVRWIADNFTSVFFVNYEQVSYIFITMSFLLLKLLLIVIVEKLMNA